MSLIPSSPNNRDKKRHCVVLFNVGGSKYKVSRSLIEQYPDTMLARLVSDTWRSNGYDSEAEIFIDRDGYRFRFVLDYMRDHRIHLPLTASKTAVYQDLKYYGFDNIPPNAIDGSTAILEAAGHMATCEASHYAELKELDHEILALERKKRVKMLAYDCFLSYSRTGSLVNIPFMPPIPGTKEDSPEHHERYENALSCFGCFDEEYLDDCLSKYGLYYVRHERRRDPTNSSSSSSNRTARYGFKVTLGSLAAASC